MSRVLRRQKSSYMIGLTLCLAGVALLVGVLLKAWVCMPSSQNFLSDLWSFLWRAQFNLAWGFGLKLMYFAILGIAMLFVGTFVVALSQEWFTLSGETVLLRCPYCKNNWKANRAKGWAECPHCRQFIQPQVMKKD